MRDLLEILVYSLLLGMKHTQTGYGLLSSAVTPPLTRSTSAFPCPTSLGARQQNEGDTAASDAANEDSNGTDKEGPPVPKRTKEEENALLGYAIDSFLRGDSLRPLDDGEPVLPDDSNPGTIVSTALYSLRGKDVPSQVQGAAIFLRFCLPLRRSERWGDASSIGKDPWKEVLRGALTPEMLLRRVRASDFAALLDWNRLDVTEGAFTADRDLVGFPSVAYVNAALFFEDDAEPLLLQFKLRRVGGGTWMIDTIRKSQKELFLERSANQF